MDFKIWFRNDLTSPDPVEMGVDLSIAGNSGAEFSNILSL
jgi:hypothetical protein